MSEEEFSNLKELIDANLSLKQRLELINKQKQQLNNGVRQAKPTLSGPSVFKAASNQYSQVKSKVDPNSITIQLKTQEEINRLKKEELELKECSFRPHINSKSSEIVQSNVYIPIYDRPAPEKRQVAESSRELEKSLTPEPNPSKTKRKVDPDFYKKQLEWARRNEERHQNERLQKQLSEHSEIYHAPRINKDSSERIVGDQTDFMERLKIQEERTRQRRQVLQSKYNDCTFKPKINSKSQNVPSRVFQPRAKDDED